MTNAHGWVLNDGRFVLVGVYRWLDVCGVVGIGRLEQRCCVVMRIFAWMDGCFVTGGQGQVPHRGHLLADRDRRTRDAPSCQHHADQAWLMLVPLLRDRGESRRSLVYTARAVFLHLNLAVVSGIDPSCCILESLPCRGNSFCSTNSTQ